MKYRKSVMGLFCFIFIAFLSGRPVYGRSFEIYRIEMLSDAETDYKEILSIEGDIFQAFESFYQRAEHKKLPDDFELDISQAKKIYVDTQVFSMENAVEVKQELEHGNYMWLLPVKMGTDTFQIHIARGLPLREAVKDMLSETQIKEIKDNEGKWGLSGMELLEGETVDYEQQISDALHKVPGRYEDAEILLCGGLEHIGSPAALVSSGEKIEYFIPLYDLKIDGTDEQIENIKPKTAGAQDKIYLYEEIRDAVNSMPSWKDSIGGAVPILY